MFYVIGWIFKQEGIDNVYGGFRGIGNDIIWRIRFFLWKIFRGDRMGIYIFFFFCIGVEFGFDVGEMVKVEFFIDFCWLRDWRVYR